MGGFKETDFFVKAYNMGLIPHSNDGWGMQYDESAYYDLHERFPIITNGKPSKALLSAAQNVSFNCMAVDNKLRKYHNVSSNEDKVQRLCRGLILKNNLSNL